MRARKRLVFGLRTYSNLAARRARARVDIRIFNAEMAGEGEYYMVSPRIKQLVKEHEDAAEAAYCAEADRQMCEQEEALIDEYCARAAEHWDDEYQEFEPSELDEPPF